MPHIHNGEGEHDLTASAIIVRDRGPLGHAALMHKHKKLDRILYPGGHVELTERPYDAVLREIEEETGYQKDQLFNLERARNGRLTIMLNAPDPQPFYVNTHQVQENPTHYHTDLSYVFFVNEEPRVKPILGESLEFYWMTRQMIMSTPKIPRNVRGVVYYVLDSI